MIKCPFCQTVHVDNTVFCSECGNYLIKEETVETNPLDIEFANQTNSITTEADLEIKLNDGPQTIQLKIMGKEKREVAISLDKVIFVGRVDPAAAVFPELDLSSEGDLAKSISRRHASILKQGKNVIVKDLGSANGTFINGKRLTPYTATQLNDGDILTFGLLPIKIKLPPKP
jgi:pSer/pThr/pTyr-binding forkhead associated (FHA) protein